MRTEAPALDVEALYQQYRSKVYAYALHHLGNPSDAEDAVSQVFLQVEQSKERYDPARSAPSTWLYAITRNEVRMSLRGRGRERAAPEFDSWDLLAHDGPSPEECLVGEEDLATLAAALQMLPERERDILLLRFYSGLPSKEVAARMGLSDANVRYLQSKALGKLRGCMEKG